MKKMVVVFVICLVLALVLFAPGRSIARAEGAQPPQKPAQWFFLVRTGASVFSPWFTTIGPFQEEAACKEVAEWTKKNRGEVSRCWMGTP